MRAVRPQLQSLTVKAPIVLAAALAALLIAAPGASAARSVPQGFFGVMYDHGVSAAPADVQDDQWDLMASSGVESVRTVFSWLHAQPKRNSPISFEYTDPVVRRAALRNIEVLPIVF
jgi:hypothetical protein